MITISNQDCQKIIDLLDAYGEALRSSSSLREWNKGRQARLISKKLKKKTGNAQSCKYRY